MSDADDDSAPRPLPAPVRLGAVCAAARLAPAAGPVKPRTVSEPPEVPAALLRAVATPGGPSSPASSPRSTRGGAEYTEDEDPDCPRLASVAAIARARWDTAFFSSACASAKVLFSSSDKNSGS